MYAVVSYRLLSYYGKVFFWSNFYLIPLRDGFLHG